MHGVQQPGVHDLSCNVRGQHIRDDGLHWVDEPGLLALRHLHGRHVRNHSVHGVDEPGVLWVRGVRRRPLRDAGVQQHGQQSLFPLHGAVRGWDV